MEDIEQQHQNKTKHKGKHDKPKPWDEDPNIDRWKVEKFDPSWNEAGMLEVSSFSTLFPVYRGKEFYVFTFLNFIFPGLYWNKCSPTQIVSGSSSNKVLIYNFMNFGNLYGVKTFSTIFFLQYACFCLNLKIFLLYNWISQIPILRGFDFSIFRKIFARYMASCEVCTERVWYCWWTESGKSP